MDEVVTTDVNNNDLINQTAAQIAHRLTSSTPDEVFAKLAEVHIAAVQAGLDSESARIEAREKRRQSWFTVIGIFISFLAAVLLPSYGFVQASKSNRDAAELNTRKAALEERRAALDERRMLIDHRLQAYTRLISAVAAVTEATERLSEDPSSRASFKKTVACFYGHYWAEVGIIADDRDISEAASNLKEAVQNVEEGILDPQEAIANVETNAVALSYKIGDSIRKLLRLPAQAQDQQKSAVHGTQADDQ